MRRVVLPLTAAATVAASCIMGAGGATAAPRVSWTRACAQVNSLGQAACGALRVTAATEHVHAFGVTAQVLPTGFGPLDLRGAYGIPANGGTGQTVAVVDAFNDPHAAADLAVYRSQYGLPACTVASGCFKQVSQTGSTTRLPRNNAGWSGEISLDLDMVSAIAPNARIVLVEASSATIPALGSAVNEAVKLGARFVSNSYGGAETGIELNWDSEYFNHPGVAITASSGDSGYGPEYPAASPDVTAVGGTSLVRSSSSPRGWSESAWSTSSTEGTGSGCSAYEAKPGWQTDSGCSRRTIADVSAVADPATGVAVYQSYGANGWQVYGGTSVGAPLIAAVYADAGTSQPAVPAADPYHAAATVPGALNDVTTGATTSCSPSYLCAAGPHYDGPTGLGTPQGLTAFAG
nr:S53 family peptidase [Streptacidiphilus rugosus]